MFIVYILYSHSIDRFYTGTTDDVSIRLNDHNHSQETKSFTYRGRPWELFFVIDGLDSEQAYKIEQHLKRMKSAVYINNLKQYPEIVAKLIERYS